MTLKNMYDLMQKKICTLLGELIDSCAPYFDADAAKNGKINAFCFHGEDILIDNKGKFWWLESNRAPAISMTGPDSIKVNFMI